jgi:tRNA modification GTPase
VILVVNKIDMTDQDVLLSLRSQLNGHPVVEVSATERTGLEGLKEEVLQQIASGIGSREERFVLRSARQRAAVSRCFQAVERASAALSGGMPLEIVALEAKDAIASLDFACCGEITEEVLSRIFSRFCIGK